MSKRRAYYVLSTHWDREWYQPFQDYRFRLVRLMDSVLNGLADGRLVGPFQTDGQAIVIEDYLEVRPERRTQVEQFIKDRKLAVGPWYAMPDEFLVSGESLIRNLRYGRELVRGMGGQPSNAGFVCDIFGHNSQMPQVFRGFDIPVAFIWRGLNTIRARNLIWRGADGTEIPAYRFGHVGYCSYAFAVRHANDRTYVTSHDKVAQDLRAFLMFEAERTTVDPILLFDGGDHQEWDQAAYEALCQHMEQPGEDFEIGHTSLDEYMAALVAQADQIADSVEGELREPGLERTDIDQQWLIPGVLSSRAWIKQANAECQTLLCQWAEPFSAYAHNVLGGESPVGYLNVAWRWLLQNHPHDSICGCSVDQVHEDMQYRFSQCRRIADRLTANSLRQLGASVAGEIQADEVRVVVFNPLPQTIEEPVELQLQIPGDWPTFNEFFGFEPKPAFRIYDAAGQELPYQRLNQAMSRTQMRIYYDRFVQTSPVNDVLVSLSLQVPAMGYTTLTVRAGEKGRPTRYPAVPGLATSERSMANENLVVTVEPNGTLTLADLRNGQTYERLLTFEDVADIGDGWYHGAAVNDQVFVSTAARADVALVHNTPLMATFRIRTTMGVPGEFRFDSMTRADRIVEVVIDSYVTLRAGGDRLEVQTTAHNVADDHRLRVLLPSGADAQTYLADAPFDIVERPIALRDDNHLYRELEVETRPQQSWTAVYGGGRGLAVISTGQLESAVRDLGERPLALTLFRGTRRTVMTNGEPNGQLRGAVVCRYWIVPLTGVPDAVRLCQLGQQLAAGLRTTQLRAEDLALERGGAQLPRTASFLSLEGAAVLSSARQVGGAFEVRLWNPTPQATRAILKLMERPAAASQPTLSQLVNLESRPLGAAEAIEAGAQEVSLGPKQIMTLRLT